MEFGPRLDGYERNLACCLGGAGTALSAALKLAREGYQDRAVGGCWWVDVPTIFGIFSWLIMGHKMIGTTNLSYTVTVE